MSFSENINRICYERGTSLSQVVKTVKGNTSFATAINKGSLPKEHEMMEMANVLGCSILDFFDNEGRTHKLDLVLDEELNDAEYELVKIYRGLSKRKQHELMIHIYDFLEREDGENND